MVCRYEPSSRLGRPLLLQLLLYRTPQFPQLSFGVAIQDMNHLAPLIYSII